MTNGNGKSTTIVRDIFGDEITQSEPLPNEYISRRQSSYGSPGTYQTTQGAELHVPSQSMNYDAGAYAQAQPSYYGGEPHAQPQPSHYGAGLQHAQPLTVNYGAPMPTQPQTANYGTFAQSGPSAHTAGSYGMPSPQGAAAAGFIMNQNRGLVGIARTRNKLGTLVTIATTLALTVGAVGSAAYFGEKFWTEQMTKIKGEIGSLKTSLEGQIVTVQKNVDDSKVLSQEELNIQMQKTLAKSTVYLKVSRINSWGERIEEEVGTGVVTDKGVVLTDLHLVKGADRILVSTSDSKQVLEAEVIHDDKLHDKALLLVHGLEAPPLPISTTDVVKGTQLFCIGNTLGEKGAFSTGEVSVPSDSDGDMLISLPGKTEGDIGSAVINKKGEIVAVIKDWVISETGEPIDGLFKATQVRDLRPILSWWQHNKDKYLGDSHKRA